MTPLTTPIFDFRDVVEDSHSDSATNENQPLKIGSRLTRFLSFRRQNVSDRRDVLCQQTYR